MNEAKRASQEFVISDALWDRIEPLLPERQVKVHPLGCHRHRIPDRQVFNGIFFILRTGGPWKSLDATGICKGSTAHSRFLEWLEAGFFARLWEASLLDYDEMKGLGLRVGGSGRRADQSAAGWGKKASATPVIEVNKASSATR